MDKCQNGTLKNDTVTHTWVSTSSVPKVLPQCTFKFCARIAEPYINPGCKSGLEVEIIKILQHKLQFNVSYLGFNLK